MKGLTFTLPRLDRLGYKMLPSNDGDTDDVLDTSRSEHSSVLQRRRDRVRTGTSWKEFRSYLDRTT